jgi:lysophospholipase L1-like esterase
MSQTIQKDFYGLVVDDYGSVIGAVNRYGVVTPIGSIPDQTHLDQHQKFAASGANLAAHAAEHAGLGVTGNRRTLVLFGDSRIRDMTAGDGINAWSSLSAHAYATSVSGYAFSSIVQSGVGGNKAADLLARAATDLYAYRPTDVIFCCGHNDFETPTPTPVATVYSTLVSIFSQCAALGIFVHHLGEYPGFETRTAARGDKMQLNALCSAYWAARPDKGRWYDVAAIVADPTSTAWAPKAGVLRDGIHYSGLLGHQVGVLLANGYKQRGTPWSPYLVSSPFDDPAINSQSVNKIQNPLMLGAGAIPAGWTSVAGSPTITKAARSDGYGNDAIVSFSGLTAYGNAAAAVDYTKIDTTKTWRLSASVSLVSPVNVASIILILNCYDGSTWTAHGILAGYTNLGQSDAFNLTLESPDLTFPTGMQFLEFDVGVLPTSGQTASCAINVGRLSLVQKN